MISAIAKENFYRSTIRRDMLYSKYWQLRNKKSIKGVQQSIAVMKRASPPFF